MAEFLALHDAVARHLKAGDTVAFEGFTHLIPHAAAHEAIRQGIGDLTLLRMTPDIIYDQMIGMGLARKVVFSYAGNPGVGLLRRMRDAIENAYPRAIETIEHSHSAMAQAYEAGASGLPVAVFRGYKGADLARVNPQIKAITCPFTGEELAAVPAHRPDVTFIHAQKASDANLPVGDPLAIAIPDRSSARLIIQFHVRHAELSLQTPDECAGAIERRAPRGVL